MFITSVEEQEEHQGISCHICACHMWVVSRQGVALHRSCLARGSAQESDKSTRGNKCKWKHLLMKKKKNNELSFYYTESFIYLVLVSYSFKTSNGKRN